MPELPEVETVRRGLMRIAAGRQINGIDIYYPKMIENSVENFKEALIGQTIERINRRGKYLLFRFSNDLTMISHLRMEGSYFNQKTGTAIDKHVHVLFHFTDGTDLGYRDTRKFGRMHLVKTGTEMQYGGLAKIGPEPTEEDLKLDYLVKIMKKSHSKIKPFLLNQAHVAGLGNIYADEVLWETQINPEEPTNQVSEAKIAKLRENIIHELARATEHHGTTVHSFKNAFGDAGKFQNELDVYGRGGEKCHRCGTKLVKIKVAQRGTTFCPRCQPLVKADD